MIKVCKNTEEELLDLENIFENNNKNYIEDKFVIRDPNFTKYIIETKTNERVGYAAVYNKKDFIAREHFPIDLNFNESEDTYIWHICIKEGHENKGLATSLIKHIIAQTTGDVYSIVNITNTPSLIVHFKLKFSDIKRFKIIHINKLEEFMFFKH